MQEERLTAHGTADIEKLTDMIKTLLDAVWGKDWGLFSDEDPTGNDPEETTLPHITYNLVSRVKTSKRPVKEQPFASIPDPDYPGEFITPKRTWFTCELEFCIYGRTRRETTVMAQRFEEFMETYAGYFKQEGVSEIIFKEEKAPDVNSFYRQDLPHRMVCYEVRIERIREERSRDIRQVEAILKEVGVEVSVGDDTYQSHFDDNRDSGKTRLGDNSFLDVYDKNFPK